MFLPMISLPLIAATIAGLFGRYIGITGTNIIVVASLLVSTVLSIILGYEVILTGSTVTLKLGTWLDTGLINIEWGFVIDPLGAWLTSTVLLISLLVHIFATSYMSSDPSPQRFMALLVAFTGFMVLLVTGDNLGVLFFGWEGIGITSFLLIGYWWDRAAACNAASQALIVNRVGDAVFTIALMILICSTYTLDLADLNLLFSLAPIGEGVQSNWLSGLEGTVLENMIISQSVGTWLGILIVISAFGKSAQFLLHTWLPSAMEGPTPVSSLLHAATLVAAGSYLLVRTSVILAASDYALLIAAIVGTITALFAGTTALVQSDMKRIIAYSTCSQFGYLTAAVGLGQTSSTILHLSSHAGFKALLFVCAGGVLHSMRDEQDLRRLGGLITFMPFTYSAMLVGSLSLIAFPYLSGHVSKDLILELSASQISVSGNFFWILGSIVAGITACYSLRLLALTFFGGASASRNHYETVHEQPLAIVIPMLVLSILAIIFGYLAREPIVGMGTEIITFSNYNFVEAEFGLSLFAKSLPLISTLLGISLGFLLFLAYPFLEPAIWRSTRTSRFIHKSLSNKWWIDAIYARAIVWPTFGLGLFGSKLVDRGIIELIGPGGLANAFSRDLSPLKASTNNIPLYALYTALFALLSITFLQFTVSINWISDFNYLVVISLATYYTLVRSSINTTTLRKSTPIPNLLSR